MVLNRCRPANPTERLPGRIWPFIGAALLLNFAVVASICMRLGVHEQIWWMSHVALVLGGTGLLLRSPLLTAAALTGVLVPHAIWLTDYLGGTFFGVHPLGVTCYMDDAGPLTWAKTLHHFYLVPVLLAAIARHEQYPAALVPTVLILFVVLAVVSRLLLPAASNVNSAFQFLPMVRSSSIVWTNHLPAVNYVVVMNAGALLVFIMPADMLIRRLTGASPLGMGPR